MLKKIVISLLVAGILIAGALVIFFKPFGHRTVETSSEAITVVVDEYPRLSGFALSSIAPRYIQTKKAENGWYIGFIEKGTDIPGIASAECYFVSGDALVTEQGVYERKVDGGQTTVNLEDCTALKETGTEPTEPVHEIAPYGTTTLAVGIPIYFQDFALRVLSIESDNRCRSGVTCVQAGTVTLKIEVTSKRGTNTNIIKLGERIVTDEAETLFVGASPYPSSSVPIATSDYGLTLFVSHTQQENPSIPPTLTPDLSLGQCYSGGCSGQVCSDDPGSVSTCEMRPEYACYRTATCERQTNGMCGWTKTPELTQCLIKSTE